MPSLTPEEFEQLVLSTVQSRVADETGPGIPQPDEPPPVPEVSPAAAQTTAIDNLLLFTDAVDFMNFCFPEIQPYDWQVEELLRLSGYCDPYDASSMFTPTVEAPILYTLQAPNGSGKDQFVLAMWSLFNCCCKRNFITIGTSSSFTQLNEQTWRHIKTRAMELNQKFGAKFLTINKHRIRNTRFNSEIKLFRTDTDKLTEGWHPLVPGGPMAIFLNETKSIDDELVIAFKRCHGYTQWINISSPGEPMGYFYERCTQYKDTAPARLVPGRQFHRKVTYKDCPHLEVEFKRAIEEFDIDHPYIQSSFLANFVVAGKLYLVSADRLTYSFPAKSSLGLPRRAGLDLSLGGDITCLSVWEGNFFVGEFEFRERHEPTLTRILCEQIENLQIPPSQIYADAGNMGTTIIQRMGEAGLHINGVHNQGKPYNPKVYRNRGAELAYGFRRLIMDKMLNLENITPKLKRQIASRLYFLNEARIQLEDKKEYRSRNGFSPDHLDAAILAHAGCNYQILRNAKVQQATTETPGQNNTHFLDEWNAIYGDLKNTTIDRKAIYRTSGIFRSRATRPLSAFSYRLGKNRRLGRG